MITLFYSLVAWATAGLAGRLLVGAGLTLVVYTGIVVGVETLLDDAALSLTGLPADILSIVLLSGVGEALTILGSAVLSRVALTMAANVAGLRRDA